VGKKVTNCSSRLWRESVKNPEEVAQNAGSWRGIRDKTRHAFDLVMLSI
jgi:hypothetical protein